MGPRNLHIYKHTCMSCLTLGKELHLPFETDAQYQITIAVVWPWVPSIG